MARIALAQLNFTVGDVDGNADLAVGAIEEARNRGAQVLALPELALTGYPPEDLLFKRSFVRAQRVALDAVAAATGDLLTVVGFVDEEAGALYNAAAVCQGGRVQAVYRKQRLPNYGVFDEQRYFRPGSGHVLAATPEGVLGVCVCEDIWYEDGPAVAQGDAGAQIIVNINASPFHKGKVVERTGMLARRARRAGASIAYVNLVGGQDELVFDGGSTVVGPDGEVLARLPQFEEAVEVVEVPPGPPGGTPGSEVRVVELDLPDAEDGRTYERISGVLEDPEEIYGALRLALRDYARKNGFEKVVLGLSGGIDSSLTATLAVDALGAPNVLGVIMPSEYSSPHSVSDAQQLAANLGIEVVEVPIKEPYKASLEALSEALGEAPMGVAEENLQARIRGNYLMFISNRFGHLVLATGNKSEGAVGYATLYGDMAGGFAPIRDLLKREVYELARWRNHSGAVIPEGVLTKAPSAELRPGQKDEDSLPPYSVLDPILEAYVEQGADFDEIVARGFDPEVVRRVVGLVDRAEYKRRQAPPGPKVTVKAFGRDRRFPITNHWSDMTSEEAEARAPRGRGDG